MKRYRKLTYLAAALLWPALGAAQQVDWQQVESMSESKLSDVYLETSVVPSWVEGADYVFYNRRNGADNTYYIVDAATGKHSLLVNDMDSLERQYRRLTGDTALQAGRLKIYSIGMHDGDDSRFTWMLHGKEMVYNRRTGVLSLAPKKAQERKHALLSERKTSDTTADSLFTMMGDQYNLYVRDNRTGVVTRLTEDGKENASYCYRSTKTEVSEGRASGRWIGHVFMSVVYDDSEVGDLYLIDATGKRRPRLRTKKMPLPNEKGVRRFRIYWYNADKGEGRLLPIDRYRDQQVSVDYTDCGNAVYFTRRSRSVDSIDLCRIDVAQGTVSTIISEVSKPHLNVSLFNYRLLNRGQEIIWWSERTGRGNYYLYDGAGRLKNRITRGDRLVAGSLLKVDTLARTIIFTGYGAEPGINPYYAFQYQARLDGKRQQCLSKGNGTHELQLSHDGRYAIDTYSRMDLPPVYNVVSLKNPAGSKEFVRRSDAGLRAKGWRPPHLVTVKAADGTTDLYGLMYLPTNLQEGRKYPIISNVYPGPQDDQIPQAFTIDDNGNQSLAEMGFVVVNVAPRGSSPHRGRDFYCFGYGNLRDYPLADDKHAIEQLASAHPFIDLDRVGIYGHSGGGFMTAAAMLTYPDFYRVGVAASGNHDNNIYIQWWGETFHGLDGKIPTNMELAAGLKGKLLLVSGDVDDNVPYASTLRLAHALIEQGKRFDMMILPGKDHGVWSPYYQNLVRYYFKENLLNPVQRDIDIINHQ